MNVISLIRDGRRARKEGMPGILRRQRTRLADVVAFARSNSPYYERLYRGLTDSVDTPQSLPVTNKKELMAHFEEWVTDRDVKLQDVRKLVDDPDRIGERFLDKYTVATTSGTTGTRGIFVMDGDVMAVTNAVAFRMITSWLGPKDMLRVIVRGRRMAMIMAAGGHFASAVAAARLQKRSKKRLRVLPADTPLRELVDELNAFRPIVVAPYASMAALLAAEQEAGRLDIHPVLIALSAEGLPLSEYRRIAVAFGAKVGNSYASTECTFLSYGCDEGWLHVNADWVIVEPVDADHRAVPPREQSHTVLISNLANRVQPILRYDLGDSVVQSPDPCPCGNPLPAIRVQGRAADVLMFEGADGRVSIPPLALGGVVEHVVGVDLSQIVQIAPDVLRVRLVIATGADAEAVWASVLDGMGNLLAAHELRHVAIERAEEKPEQSAAGKFRHVIPLAKTEASS